MLINEFQWKNYLEAGGNKVVEMFEKMLDIDLFVENFKEIEEDLLKIHSRFSIAVTEFKREIDEFEENGGSYYLLKDGSYTIYDALDAIIDVFETELEIVSDSDKCAFFTENMECISMALSTDLPNIFVPWFFKYSFNIFRDICDYFNVDIDFNELPVKSDYLNRIYYYGDICHTLCEFKEENNFTSAELCAFLYDYAPQVVLAEKPLYDKITSEPRNAYFIGAPGDYFKYQKKHRETLRFWQTNPDVQVGDAMVMYVRSPISQIKYIWRAVSPGFVDPFFWYYRCANICYPIEIDGMTINQLKADEITSKLPIVKKNLQGINGTHIPPTIYNHILDTAKVKENEKLPYIEYALDLNFEKNLENERDVEVVLLEPLLEKLGYKKEHWCRQMTTKIGRKERAIPDYVVFPVYTPGKERGKIVLEAKLTITDKKALEEDRRQAASYGKQLLSDYTVLVSKEGIYLYGKADNFESCIFNSTWTKLENDKDEFNKLYKFIGNNRKNN